MINTQGQEVIEKSYLYICFYKPVSEFMSRYCHDDEVEMVLNDGHTLSSTHCPDPGQTGVRTGPWTGEVVPVCDKRTIIQTPAGSLENM